MGKVIIFLFFLYADISLLCGSLTIHKEQRIVYVLNRCRCKFHYLSAGFASDDRIKEKQWNTVFFQFSFAELL